MFTIRLDIPQMKDFWKTLEKKVREKSASKKNYSFKYVISFLNCVRDSSGDFALAKAFRSAAEEWSE